MATSSDPESSINLEQLQKDTQDRLRKQDQTIAKLEKKIDKMQEQSNTQMHTLDVRMQQMMGMFQMFMMNQSAAAAAASSGMPMQQTVPPVAAGPPLHTPQLPVVPNLQQSQSDLNSRLQSTPLELDSGNNNKQLRVVPKSVYKSRSIGQLDSGVRSGPESEYESDFLSDNERSRSKSRRRHKHKSRKERKKDKKEKRRDRKKDKKRREDSGDGDGDRDRDRERDKERDGRDRSRRHKHGRKAEKRGTSRSHNNSKNGPLSHEKSRSESVRVTSNGGHTRKHKKRMKTTSETMVDVVDFVPIAATKAQATSPTKSESGLLDRLDQLELDVETPSDEESLLYVADETLNKPSEDDGDIDDTGYDWKRNKTQRNDDEDDDDDDLSMLSEMKQSAVKIEGADSDYSDEEAGAAIRANSESSGRGDDEDEDREERRRREKERRRQKKREQKKLKKEKKRRKEKEKEKDRTSNGAGHNTIRTVPGRETI